MSRRPRVEEPKEHYFPLRGGMDLITPPYQIQPGKMIDCVRYEIAPSGGLKPIDGYERVDGHGLPSEAQFQCVEYANTEGNWPGLENWIGLDDWLLADSETNIAAGLVVTGVTSAAKGISLAAGPVDFGDGVIVDLSGNGCFLLTSGIFVPGEELTVAGIVVATIGTVTPPNSEKYDIRADHYHWLAVEARRGLIAKVPGSGPVRGVWRYDGTLYAFRDNAGGTACLMYEEENSAAGWKLVITPVLAPGGSYRFENTNFGGSATTIKMYGCDGKNKAFEFDGTNFNQITTGMTTDKPILICEHKKHLFLGFTGGSLQHSPPTDPRGVWTVVLNAGELGMGEELSEVMGLPGGVLGIWCKDSIHILSGTGVGSWVLEKYSSESGGIAGTVQNAGRVIFLNNTGLADFSATNAFGSFKSGTISGPVQPLLDQKKKYSCGSVVMAKKNQYRIFFTDGSFLTASIDGRDVQFSQGSYDLVVRCISAPKRADDELGNVYFGSDDGYVYKMDSGLSLDHRPMTAFCRLPYAHQGSPRYKKRYREIVVELDAFGGKKLYLEFWPDFSMTSTEIPQHVMVDVSEEMGSLGMWNVSEWEAFNWDAATGGAGTASGRVDGVSTEIGLMLYFNAVNTVTPIHILNGIFTYFNILGRKR